MPHAIHYALSVAVVLALGGCSSPGPDRGGLFDRIAGADHVQGGSDQVTIHGMSSAADALPLAIGHCSHFKKSAQYARRAGDDFVFNCVAKS